MNPIFYIKLILQHFVTFSVIVIFTVCSSIFFSYSFFNDYKTKALIFTTIGVVNESRAYDHVQGAAYFAETVQGWLKNPVFLEKILSKSQVTASITAYRQERQNMVIEITAKSKNDAEVVSENVVQLLSEEISQYNTETNSNFTIMVQGEKISEVAGFSLISLIIVGFFIGSILGTSFIGCMHYCKQNW